MNAVGDRWPRVGAPVLAALLVGLLTACGPDATTGAAPPATARPTVAASIVPTTTGPACAAGQVPANLTLPEPAQLQVRVVNASGRAGLATTVGADLRSRRIQVVGTTTASLLYKGIVTLTYGPRAVGAAWLLRSYFLIGPKQSADWRDDFRPDRVSLIVDVTLGTGFQQLATATEVNQSIAALGHPTAPAGVCGR